MNTINTITAEIAAAQAIIDKARPLADKFAEMQAAVASIAQAAHKLDVLRVRLADAEKAQAVIDSAVSRYRVDSIRAGHSASATAASRHTVTLSRTVHGIYGPEPITERFALDGLSSELLAVVLANVDAIPSYILALDNDPSVAIRKHAQAVSRGYMTN